MSEALLKTVDSLRLPGSGDRPRLIGPRSGRRPRLPDVDDAMRIIDLAQSLRRTGDASDRALAERVLDFFEDPLNPTTMWALRRERDAYARA